MESELAPDPTKETVQTTPTQPAAIHPASARGEVHQCERGGGQPERCGAAGGGELGTGV